MRNTHKHALLFAILLTGGMLVAGCEMPPCGPTPESNEPPPPCAKPGDQTVSMYLPNCKECAVLKLQKVAPQQATTGESFTYHILVKNVTDNPVRSVRVHEILADNYSVTGTDPKASSDGQKLVWNLGTLKAGEERQLKVMGTVNQSTTITNCTTAVWGPPLLCVDVKSAKPQLAINKTGPNQKVICDPLTYQIVVKNTGDAEACDIAVEDNLPQGMSTLDGETKRVYRISRLAPGEQKSFSLQTRVKQTGNYTNQADLMVAGKQQARSNPVTTEVVTPVLVVTKDAPSMRYLNRPITYTITVANKGDYPAKNTVLTEELNQNVQYVSASDGGQRSGSTVQWNLGTIDPGQSKTVKVTVKATSKGRIVSVSRAKAYCASDDTQAAVQVEGIPAILLETVDVHDPIEVGAQETYEITVTNQGSADDNNVKVTVMLPPEQDYISSSGPTKAVRTGKTVEFQTLPVLKAGHKAVWRVMVKGNATGDVRFRTKLQSDMMTSPAEESESTHIYE